MEKIIKLLGIDIPLIQAPMAGIQDSSLAISVSKTGALGSLPCAMLDLETLHTELKKIKENTDKPVNLNFFSHVLPEKNEKQEEKWIEILKPYFEELEIDYSLIPKGVSRIPFGQEHLELLKDFKPSIMSFHFGLPEYKLLEPLKEWGATILSSATTVEEAKWLEAHGADIIIAQGLEAGGHRGMFLTEDISTQMGTFTLLPQIVESVCVPVIAAGGIVNVKGIKAAHMLGASGVQIGTAYMLCNEVLTSHLHRESLKSVEACHTAITNIFTGRPARGIVNYIMQDLGLINKNAPAFPYASASMNALKQRAEEHGNRDFSNLWAGENVTGCKEISASELTLKLAEAYK